MGMTNTFESRLPDPTQVFPELGAMMGLMAKPIQGGAVPQITINLVQLRAGQVAGSTYLTTGQTALLRAAGESEQRITAVATWRDAPFFSEAERVALELAEAVLTPGKTVSDELYGRAAAHYDDKALWALTLAIGQISYLIPVALIGKPVPGMPPGQNYTR